MNNPYYQQNTESNRDPEMIEQRNNQANLFSKNMINSNNPYEPGNDAINKDFQDDFLDNTFTNGVNQQMRLGFIRKVYGVLTAQILITALVSSIGFIQGVQDYYKITMWPFWTSFALMLIVLIPLACFKKIARQVPLNYILLFTFTVCEAIMLSYAFAAINDWKIVLTAAVMTVAIVAALTAYACTTKTDFTFLGGILFVSSTLLFLLGLFSIFFGGFLHTLYCCLGVIVFSIYLIFDTQLVMGQCGIEYSVDDYILASLNIYLDIIQLFIYILSLLSKK
jgi:FtsH-binding integral membrane protein